MQRESAKKRNEMNIEYKPRLFKNISEKGQNIWIYKYFNK